MLMMFSDGGMRVIDGQSVFGLSVCLSVCPPDRLTLQNFLLARSAVSPFVSSPTFATSLPGR